MMSSFCKRLAAALVIFLATMSLAQSADASHFRYGTISWRVADPVTAPLTVDFTILHAWRTSPAINLHYGDGNSEAGVVVSVGTGNDAGGLPYTVYKTTLSHTYASAGSYVAYFEACCRISELENAADDTFRVETTVDLNAATPPNTSGPVSSAPGFPIQMKVGQINKYIFPVTDSDYDPVICRIATTAEASRDSDFSPTLPVSTTGATSPTFQITPEGDGCEVTWDLSNEVATDVGKSYAMPIMMESTHDGNISTTALDVMVEFVASNATLPTCSTGGVFIANPDQPTPFTHAVTGTDSSSSLILTSINAPNTSTFNPAPTDPPTLVASPFTTTFSWSPQAADIGSHVVQANFTNGGNLSATCYLTILVPDCPNFGDACTLSVGECAANGTYICSAPGTKECNAQPAAPTAEICDTLDNDCDGFYDETFPELGDSCSVGVGDCEATGQYVCAADGLTTECDATAGSPATEVCDSKDNNCDGAVDETFTDLGDTCTIGVGTCAVIGNKICATDGTGTECDATPGMPGTEICGNALDEDCDGQLDNDCDGTGGSAPSSSSSSAGVGGSSASAGGSAPGLFEESSGCSCKTGPHPSSPWGPWAIVALFGAWLTRRRPQTNRRTRLRAAPSILLIMLFALSCNGKDPDPNGAGGASGAGGDSSAGGASADGDTDGDTISDVDEGAADNVDTDEDGTPDFQDSDSDNDDIPDLLEAGDTDISTAPRDSDNDGTADFRDLDADENGILDKDEGTDDSDGDGNGNWIDDDNDGDLSLDIDEIVGSGADCDNSGTADAAGTAAEPADCDGDGTANYMDLDSDGDTILDKTEGDKVDTDGDSFHDRYDLDSDNDLLPDKTEAGDEDLQTAPVDTDEDGTADYLDPDSDDDGISDLNEVSAGTSPTKTDSDDDGVSDLVESAAGTDPLDSADNPQSHGNFVFVVPYQKPSEPSKDTLEFGTSVQYADIYFSIDESETMGDELSAMKGSSPTTGVPGIINTLSCDLPNAQATMCSIDTDCGANQVCFNGGCIKDPVTANGGLGCIPDMWTGVGTFTTCNSFKNLQHLQPNPAVTAAAIPTATVGGGSEAVIQAAACVADQTICSNDNQCSSAAAVTSPVGCVGFRPEAVRMLVQITDADNQGGTCSASVPTIATAGNALKTDDIKFVGLYGTGDDQFGPFELCNSPKECADRLGVESDTLELTGVSCTGDVDCEVFPGAVCINTKCNRPFTLPALDSAVVDATATAILQLVRGLPLNVTIAAADETGDAGDALQFIDYLEVNLSGGKCSNVSTTADTNADSHDDAFPALPGGTSVCWDVNPVAQNTTVQPATTPQLFEATLTVYGDGSPVDSRTVFFLVPPAPPEIEGPN